VCLDYDPKKGVDKMYGNVPLTAWDEDFGMPSLIVITPRGMITASSQGVVGVSRESDSVLYADGAGRLALLTGLASDETDFLARKHFG